MTPRITLAIAARVLRQLRHDPRTVAMLLVVPSLLVTLMRYVFDARPATFNAVGAPLVGLFPLISMFLISSITVLRERTSGTLERLLTMPLAKLDILVGYAIAFAGLAALQALVVSVVAFGLLGLDVAGSPLAVGALAVANALLGMALGLLVSAGRAVPAGLRAAAAAAVRAVLSARRHGTRAAGRGRRAAADLRLRLAAARRVRRRPRRPRHAGRGGHPRGDPHRARARGGDLAPAHGVARLTMAEI